MCLTWFTVLNVLFTISVATLQLTIPPNAQVPPVAYVSEFYKFTFLANTFQADCPLTYSLIGQPSWLSVDSQTHTLSGTPSAKDVGDVTFELTASCINDPIFTNVTLVILASRSIQVQHEEVISSLVKAGKVSAPSTLYLYPSSAFNIKFAPDVFVTNSSATIYYATSADRSPLPSWIIFEPNTLRYSGTTPFLPSSPAQRTSFGISLIASRVAGFSEAIATFEIVVASHILNFQSPELSFMIAENQSVQIPSLLSRITRDSATISPSDIQNATTDSPDWLSFNSNSLSFHGIAPPGLQWLMFSITIVDHDGNQASMRISLQGPSNSLILDLGDVTVMAGTDFLYSFAFLSPNATKEQLSVSWDPYIPWLTFDSNNASIYGQVPPDILDSQINVSVAYVNVHGMNEHASLQIFIYSATEMNQPQLTNVPTVASSLTATASIPPLSTRPDEPQDNPRPLILATVLPFLLVICVISLTILIIKRRSKHENMKRKEPKARQDAADPRQRFPSPSNEILTSLGNSSRSSVSLHCVSLFSSLPNHLSLSAGTQTENDDVSNSAGRNSSYLRGEEDAVSNNSSNPSTRRVSCNQISSRLSERATIRFCSRVSTSSSSSSSSSSISNSDGKQSRSSAMSSSKNRFMTQDTFESNLNTNQNFFSNSISSRKSWKTTFGTISSHASHEDNFLLNFPIPPCSSGGVSGLIKSHQRIPTSKQKRMKEPREFSQSDQQGNNNQSLNSYARDLEQVPISEGRKCSAGDGLELLPAFTTKSMIAEIFDGVRESALHTRRISGSSVQPHGQHVLAPADRVLGKSMHFLKHVISSTEDENQEACAEAGNEECERQISERVFSVESGWVDRLHASEIAHFSHTFRSKDSLLSDEMSSHEPCYRDQRIYTTIEESSGDQSSQSFAGSIRFI